MLSQCIRKHYAELYGSNLELNRLIWNSANEKYYRGISTSLNIVDLFKYKSTLCKEAKPDKKVDKIVTNFFFVPWHIYRSK